MAGFKSISREQSIEIRPLTILAGANSSGKSSIMQPLLLLKQTLEASYDPGSLRLDGPNVRFTSADQFLSYISGKKHANNFHIGIETGDNISLTTYFKRDRGKALEVHRMIRFKYGEKIELQIGMSVEDIKSKAINPRLRKMFENLSDRGMKTPELRVTRNRCFLEVQWEPISLFPRPSEDIEPYIRELIHLPGLRGNPERTYLVAAVGPSFSGTFENYAASVIVKWQSDKDNGNLERLCQDLKELGLTWKVSAMPINDTQVELQVGRLPQAVKGGARDMVSIADVGFGVSQTLPVVVALHVARPGQLLYLEQPEIHLHPRAQTAMARVLAEAANRGVHVVAETHSSLLLLGIQTLVAEGKLSPDKVKLHWFKRQGGVTKVESADLDETGSFGDWPEDFADITLEAQDSYLDAAEARMTEQRRAS